VPQVNDFGADFIPSARQNFEATNTRNHPVNRSLEELSADYADYTDKKGTLHCKTATAFWF